MKKKNMTADESKNISMSGKRLIVSLLVLAFVIFAYAIFSGAWFSIGKITEANGMRVNVQSVSSKDFVLYRWDETLNSNSGGWETVSKIDMSGAVPNQCERYMVISPSAYNNIKFTLDAVGDNGNNQAEENLFDYIYISNVQEENTEVTPSAYGSALPAEFSYNDCDGSQSVSALITNTGIYNITTNDCKTAVFDVYLSKDVCSYFSTWSFTGTIIVE